eukprot:1149206-Pelagomonas_calceolata.AAC.2
MVQCPRLGVACVAQTFILSVLTYTNTKGLRPRGLRPKEAHHKKAQHKQGACKKGGALSWLFLCLINMLRCIKASNQKVKEDILSLPGASCVIVEAGFVQTGDGSGDFLFPSPGAAGEQEALKRASLVAAKLQQLVDKRGFTDDFRYAFDVSSGAKEPLCPLAQKCAPQYK